MPAASYDRFATQRMGLVSKGGFHLMSFAMMTLRTACFATQRKNKGYCIFSYDRFAMVMIASFGRCLKNERSV